MIIKSLVLINRRKKMEIFYKVFGLDFLIAINETIRQNQKEKGQY